MAFSIIFILLGLLKFSNSQWQTQNSFLNYNEIFNVSTGPLAFQNSGYFLLPTTQTTANFITCTTPLTSYITLNNTQPSALNYFNYSFINGNWMSMDVFFQGTWKSEIITFTIGSFTYTYKYTSPNTYSMQIGFCDNFKFEVKTLNFTINLASTTFGQIQFTSSNKNQGQVSLRNIYVSKLQCYPSCNSCTGPKYNQCTSCYYNSPTNNICPFCPSNQYYWKNQGCKDICEIYSPLYINGFCQSYQIQFIDDVQVTLPIMNSENLKWSLLYDQQHVDISPTIILVYNIHIHMGYFNKLSTYNYAVYLIGLKISIFSFNDIPINCGIQFKINNTYYGSIYRNASGIQTHRLKISQNFSFGSYLTYSSTTRYDLITYVDIPKNSFLFSAIGNYTDNTAGWGMSQIQITSGYCSQYCLLCEVPFKCKTCQIGFYNYRDSSCIQSCQSPYQRINESYCYDYDDETPYSQYLIQEYINAENDPGQYAQYSLISSSGTNFLKGSDIYYSYFQGIRVFGGPFVWAQAKFQRIHDIVSPHHSITIAFYILYGPKFPGAGKFIYQIENNPPVSQTSANFYQEHQDGSRVLKVYEKILHKTNKLTITWECQGSTNEPIEAYCGFYNYYIAVHNCKPYCSSCSDQTTCNTWNSTYDASIVKLSQAECLINQFYDKDSVRCFDCPQSCLTCKSRIDCQTCSSTYTQTKSGCICKMNQYEDSNQCFDCPIECNQCLSYTYCIECLNSNFRQLSNGQCICMDGYYPILSNPQCQLCHQLCKTCVGPSFNECLTCNGISNIEQDGSTCRCPIGFNYQDEIKGCSVCHQSCLTCFRTTIDGCLTCDSNQNRILKGLKCTCSSGYYEYSNICTHCPYIEDSSLSQCYKQCNTNQQIWHTIKCDSCDSGFQLISGECQPICGDSLIKGYEQCEDNNLILNDLCYNCQFQCPSHCLTCDQSTILPCPDVCGDGIITGIEQCEDGNTIQYDGCFNCKYQCQSQCTKCIKGQCFECATPGWYIDPTVTPWQCKEKCGDQIVGQSEQCDDGNFSDTDGCKDCKFFCRIGCSSCDYTTNTCLSCEFTGFIPISFYCQNNCGDGLVVQDPYGFYSEQCDDGNTINDDGCNTSCQFQCQPSSICTSCINNRCEICNTGYQLSNAKICIPICGDSMLLVGEQCENSSILPYKGCINCQAQCQSSCLTCNTSGLGCLSCKNGYNRIDNLCYSFCGDKIKTEDEECDDGNLIIGDGCHFCQFTCQDSCLNCILGVCYDCKEGYELIQSKCYSICGDGAQIYNEFCEMISSLQIHQICKSCQLSCDLNCSLCQFGICQRCQEGFELSSNQQHCIKSLQYTSTIIENCQFQIGNSCIQCENYSYFDKFEQKCNFNVTPLNFCQYQLKLSPDLYCSYCFDYCLSCNDNNCIICQSGYYLDDNFSCISSCGDKILAHDEQCEMDNQNCLSCMFDVPKLCVLYFEEICYQCEHGYYINQFTNICESKCGDGIIVHDEDCEDNNFIEFDGCYYCKFSCSQQCLNCLNGACLECNKNYYLWNGFCYINKNDIDGYPQCELYLRGECLICSKYYKLNEYGDCIPDCQESCLQCYNNKCFQCTDNYELNENTCILIQQCFESFYFNQELQICESQCGDGFINGWEECDDQNMQQFDGCYQCKYECDNNCIQCIYGECLQCSQEFNLIENKCQSKCQETCLNCVQGVCQLCISGYFLNQYLNCIKINCEYDHSNTSECGYGIIENLEQCDDQNLINNDDCNNYCEQNCDNNCNSCIDGVCYECKEGWRLNTFFCYPICGDQIVAGNEECDDGNQISFDGCFQCKFQCTQYCEICLYGICQSCQINYDLDQLKNSCKSIQSLLTIFAQPNCRLLNNNQCIICQIGYLDLITNTCIIDYNMNKCSKNCKQCLLQQCLECEYGYYGNKCIPKCGDGIIVQEEECDDVNQYHIDTCLNCKYQCPQQCKQCAYGVCTQCFIGFYLDIVSNSCNSICGDNILANDEVCDDGNELKYDGCFQCKYQCQIECLNCYFGKCISCESPLIVVQLKGICEQLKQCEGLIGFYYDNYSNDCQPQCGDGIVVGNEQCEDQNSIPYDGCYDCQYQCHILCTNCQKGSCFECQTGYYLNGQQCVTKCGDGIKNGDEQCDDHNDILRDGCSLSFLQM